MLEMKIGYKENIIEVEKIELKNRYEYTLIINGEEIDSYDNMQEVETELETTYNRDINNIYLESFDYLSSEKVSEKSNKSCSSCMEVTEHTYVETYEKNIQNYRPHSGRRFLKARDAKEIEECWQCSKCGHYGRFNYKITY